ncbi:MAG: ABC transporter ATP-binding protein [Bryobacteraceae bacterium]|nr:ABC transporter ATP-binding protein [Bryobacteraceae bacterium]
MTPLLECDISSTYRRTGAGVRDIRFAVGRGEILGIAGESGSGKSTIASAILGLSKYRGGEVTGSIRFDGQELVGLAEKQWRALRGRRISLVSQSSMAALNPALRLRTQFGEAWRAHRRDGDWRAAATPTLELLRVPVTAEFLERYPSELSVGLAQRVLVALALLHEPQLLIADEPTSALDLVTQAELLGLFRKLRDDRGLSIVFISHDLLALTAVCDRIAVLRSGSLVEIVDADRFLTSPTHEYTRQLVAALRAIALPALRAQASSQAPQAGAEAPSVPPSTAPDRP